MSITNLNEIIKSSIYWRISAYIYEWHSLSKYYELLLPYNKGLDIIELPFRRIELAVENNFK